MAQSCVASTWSPRAPRLRAASGSCSRTSHRTGRSEDAAHRPGSDDGGTAHHRHLHRPDPQLRRAVGGQQGPQRHLQREPQPGSSRRGSPSSASSSTTTSPSTHAARPAAVRPLRHHQLPHAPLRPRRHLRAGSQPGPAVLRPQRPGQVPDREDDAQHIEHRRPTPSSTSSRSWSTTYRATPPARPIIADPRNDQTLIILQLHVAMQMFHNRARGLHARNPGAPGGGVRVGPAAGPVALPVGGDPRVPARHRRPGHDRLGVQGSPDRGADHQHQVLQADEPAGSPLHPGRVLGGRLPLRPQHHPTPLHRPGLSSPPPAPRGRLERAAVRGLTQRQQPERLSAAAGYG